MSGSRLVGRDQDLAATREALVQAAAGRPQIVLISGEAGIGKSRLVEEVTRGAEDTFLVALGACSPIHGIRLPYAPILDLLDDLRDQADSLDLTVPSWLAVDLLTGAEPTPTLADPGLAATRQFAAFAGLVSQLSRARPVLLVLEDAHWIDPASLDLLSYTARRIRRGRVALIITTRPGENPARAALGELRRLPGTLDLRLAALGPATVRDLIDDLAEPPGESRLAAIIELSQGIPFFALQLARYGGHGGLPPQLRDVLLGSLDDLTAQQRQLLVLLALSGADAPHELLASACHGAVEQVADVTRCLADRGLIVSAGQTVGFRHALLREVVLAETLPSERQLAHARIADALLASPMAESPSRAAQLAHHLQGCGRHREALQHALRAARHAGRVWAFEDARLLFAAAVQLWDLVEDPELATETDAVTVLLNAAGASRWCGRFDEADEFLDRACGLPEANGHTTAKIERERGQALWAAGRMGEALQAYRRALEVLPADGEDLPRAELLAALAQGQMATGQARDALTSAAAAVENALATGNHRVRLHALITQAVARAQLGEVEAAVAALGACTSEARALQDMELVLRSYGNLTFALGLACRYRELAEAAGEGVEVCRQYGPVVSLASTLITNQVSALVALGRWPEAIRIAEESLAEVSSGAVAEHLRASLAEVAVARGDDPAALELVSLRSDTAGHNPYVRAALAMVDADRLLWGGDPAAAAGVIAEVLPDLQAQDDRRLILEAAWRALRAEADLARLPRPQRPSTSASRRDELLALTAPLSPATAAPLLPVVEAEAARVDGTDTAAQWLRAAERQAEFGRSYVHAYCLMRAGAAHLRGQARSAAARVLGQAARLATDLGARPLLEEIETLLRLGGLPCAATVPADLEAPVERPAAPLGLTPREVQILGLLTTGATNRMIARSLFISERTASVHVSNILGKLGAANRTEAARMALSLDLDPAVNLHPAANLDTPTHAGG